MNTNLIDQSGKIWIVKRPFQLRFRERNMRRYRSHIQYTLSDAPIKPSSHKSSPEWIVLLSSITSDRSGANDSFTDACSAEPCCSSPHLTDAQICKSVSYSDTVTVRPHYKHNIIPKQYYTLQNANTKNRSLNLGSVLYSCLRI